MPWLSQSTSSSVLPIDPERVARREEKLTEPRYGISLIAGWPFNFAVRSAIWKIQLEIARVTFDGAFLPDPSIVHMTILRGASSRTPLNSVGPAPSALEGLVGKTAPVRLCWSAIALDPDGAIRAYSKQPDWPWFANDGMVAASILAQQFGVNIAVQHPLWATIGTLRFATCKEPLLRKVRTALGRFTLPEISIKELRLVYYRDRQLASADVIKTYGLSF